MHPAALSDDLLLRDCEITRTRRSGPGGQHRNKVETAIVLEHRLTGIKAEANECRSQAENQAQALFRLRLRLAVGLRGTRRRDEPPSELWCSRVGRGRIAINPQHSDFPTLLAEVLDHMALRGYDFPITAEHFSCSATQLAKCLQLHPPAWETVQTERVRVGLPRLRAY